MTPSPKVHPTAIIADDAVLAPDVQVGPYAVIGSHVEIGAGCVIGSHAVVHGPTKMGRENRVFQFASIGEGHRT
jgi:UDP-N-acetylglucosamine acyltransferase